MRTLIGCLASAGLFLFAITVKADASPSPLELTPCPLTLDPVAPQPVAPDGQPVYFSDAPVGHLFDGLRLSLAGEYLYGHAGGFAQIPAGGEPGSTSHSRPRFGEIGIHDVNLADVQLLVETGPHGVFLGGQFARFSGSDVLGTELVSHGVTFPAGTQVSSSLNLDWYRIGYHYRLDLGEVPGGALALVPSIAGALFDFDYKLTGGGERAARSFAKPTVLGAVELQYALRSVPLSFDLMLAGTPPVSTLPQIYQEQISARYRFLTNSHFALDGSLGLAFEQFDFQDHQRVPNHVRIDLGPLLMAGVRIEF